MAAFSDLAAANAASGAGRAGSGIPRSPLCDQRPAQLDLQRNPALVRAHRGRVGGVGRASGRPCRPADGQLCGVRGGQVCHLARRRRGRTDQFSESARRTGLCAAPVRRCSFGHHGPIPQSGLPAVPGRTGAQLGARGWWRCFPTPQARGCVRNWRCAGARWCDESCRLCRRCRSLASSGPSWACIQRGHHLHLGHNGLAQRCDADARHDAAHGVRQHLCSRLRGRATHCVLAADVPRVRLRRRFAGSDVRGWLGGAATQI